MIGYIRDVWYDKNIIIEEIIYKSFRVTGIANKLDHFARYFFSSWKKMKEENHLIKNNMEKIFDLYVEENESEVLDEDDDDF